MDTGKCIPTTIFLLFFTLWGFSQNVKNNSAIFEIKGQVLDIKTNQPLEYATISIYKQKDSSLVTGAVSNKMGRFKINTKLGRFYLKIDFIGYLPKVLGGIILNKEHPIIDLEKILLKIDVKTLTAVEVTGERSRMELLLDKKVFHVGKDIANVGGSAADILDHVPSVSVDLDGNITLRGNSNVKVLVDGKPTALTGISSSEALQQFPANIIEKIEVITNPSARYDAEGNAGIINIILKKERKLGWNGAINLSAAVPASYTASVNMNYRRKKVNWFGAYSYGYSDRDGALLVYRETTANNVLSILDQNHFLNRIRKSHSIRFGADFFLNDKNTITSSLFYSQWGGNLDVDIALAAFDFNKILTSLSNRLLDESNDNVSLDYRLNYRKTFEQKGKLLKVDLKFGNGAKEEAADIVERQLDLDYTLSSESSLLQQTMNDENQQNFVAQVDFIQPYNTTGKWEVGYKSGIKNLGNDYEIREQNNAAQWQLLTNLSNDFSYKENVQAAYGLIGNNINKFSFQIGIRGERSIIETNLKETNDSNKKEYLNLFPSAHFTYKFEHENSLQVSFSRRVWRPSMYFLNPFHNLINPQNIRSGNPDLDPTFTHISELTYLKNWDKTSITAGVYYRRTKNAVYWIKTLENGITHTFPDNLVNTQSFGIENTLSYELTKWWSLDASLTLFRRIIDGSNLGEEFNNSVYSWEGKLNSKFNFKDFDIFVKTNYRAPAETPQGNRAAIFYTDLGISKDILKSKATIMLQGKDIFKTRERVTESFGNNFFIKSDYSWQTRQIILGFTYRINQKKKRNIILGGNSGGQDF